MSILSASCLHQMIGCSLSSYVVFWRRLGRDLIGFARWFDMSLSAFSKRWRDQIQKRGELFAALPDTKIMFFEGDSKSYMKYIDINGVVKASCMPCFPFFDTLQGNLKWSVYPYFSCFIITEKVGWNLLGFDFMPIFFLNLSADMKKQCIFVNVFDKRSLPRDMLSLAW